jgi:hypothetical protein
MKCCNVRPSFSVFLEDVKDRLLKANHNGGKFLKSSIDTLCVSEGKMASGD